MSKNSGERTCLICGLHTNQTINIYEPRCGPNIVQLIQAKFKFQPLNEDKYLCFSCNNWLINWHSLQALNSNDGENPSGTYQSELNSSSGSNSSSVQKPSNVNSNQNQKQRPIAICHPIIREQQSLQNPQQPPLNTANRTTAITSRTRAEVCTNVIDQEGRRVVQIKAKPMKWRYFKIQQQDRRQGTYKLGNLMLKQTCSICHSVILLRLSKRLLAKNKYQTRRKYKNQLQCSKCRKFQIQTKANKPKIKHNIENLVVSINQSKLTTNQTRNHANNANANANDNTQHTQYLQKPLVDGKIVAMLRRLGTTLSAEEPLSFDDHNTNDNSYKGLRQLPRIMSPSKPKPHWKRPIEDDEILIQFDASIVEVLPTIKTQITHFNTTVRKRLIN